MYEFYPIQMPTQFNYRDYQNILTKYGNDKIDSSLYPYLNVNDKIGSTSEAMSLNVYKCINKHLY